ESSRRRAKAQQWRSSFSWVLLRLSVTDFDASATSETGFSLGHKKMDATVVIALITKGIQFFAGHGLHTAVHGQNIPAQAVNGIGPGRGGGRICRIPSFHSNRASSNQSP